MAFCFYLYTASLCLERFLASMVSFAIARHIEQFHQIAVAGIGIGIEGFQFLQFGFWDVFARLVFLHSTTKLVRS